MLVKALVAISIPFYVWLGSETLRNMRFRAEVTGNRWTAKDQAAFQTELFDNLTEILNALGEHAAAMSSSFGEHAAAMSSSLTEHKDNDHPPAWFIDSHNDLERRVDRHDVILGAIREDLAAIKAAVVK